MEADSQALIIDNGSGFVKLGLSQSEGPGAIVHNIAGTPKHEGVSASGPIKQVYYANEAISKRGLLKLVHPVKNGFVTNWDYLTEIWRQGSETELKCDPSKHPLFVTDPIKSAKVQKEKLMNLAFEKFGVPGFFVGDTGANTLFSQGKTTGLVVDIGDGCFQVVPVMDGYSLSHAASRLNFGGRDILDTLDNLLQGNGLDHGSLKSLDILRDLKEKHCYVSQDYEAELEKYSKGEADPISYELPDGVKIDIGDAAIRCPESLFEPYVLGEEFSGVHHVVKECINKTDMSVKKTMWESVILSGGSTMFKGMQDRMKSELKKLAPGTCSVSVFASQDRQYSNWKGAAVLSELASFSTKWITRKEYEENGNKILAVKGII